MRKAVVLLIGILMLGGMMGMVSAFTPKVDGSPLEWARIGTLSTGWYGPTKLEEFQITPSDEYAWIDPDQDSLSSAGIELLNFQLTADESNLYFLINLTDVSTAKVLILIDKYGDGVVDDYNWYIFDPLFYSGVINVLYHSTEDHYGYDTAILIDAGSDRYRVIYHDVSANSYWSADLTSIGGNIAISTDNDVIELSLPRQYNNDELVNNGPIKVTVAVIGSIDDTIDTASGDTDVIYDYNFVDADVSAVPFFSNAALALLLALVAVWFFKRK